MSTDIIIVSYNDKEPLERCIESVKSHCSDFNLIIEDNNPPNINRGFTKAVNDGIKKGKADFIWLLNSDAIVLPGAQEGLIMRLKSYKRAGIAGSMQIDYDNKDLIRHGGTTKAFPGGVHKGGYISMGHCRFPEKQKWVNYASVMFKREMFDQIGPLDERMFLIFSDSDYCYTARKNGWEVWYEPSSKVYHKLNVSKTTTDWHKKDMVEFMKKWGIIQISANEFAYSPEFIKLNTFP